METLKFAINVIFPIILPIFLGYFLKKIGFFTEDWLKMGNKLVFKVCIPCLMFINIYNIESFSKIDWNVVIYTEIITLILFLLGIAVVKLTIPDDRQKGVVLQCVLCSNFGIIGISLAEALGGANAVGIAAVIGAFASPTINVLSVIALTMFLKAEDGKKVNFKHLLKSIATNPLILGVLCGLVALALRSMIPNFTIRSNLTFLYTTLNNISKITSPLALIICGGLFNFNSIKSMRKQIIIATAARVVVVPFLVISVAILLINLNQTIRFGPDVFAAFLALFAPPVAVSSAIVAQEMDNDGILAGQLVVWTSIASMFTLFLFIFALRTLGYL